MIAFALAAALCCAEVNPYPVAYAHAEAGTPVVIVITGPGCSWCEKLKKETLLPAWLAGELNGIDLCVLDASDEVAKQIIQGQGVPQVRVVRRAPKGDWKYQHRVGYIDRAELKRLLEAIK